MATTDTRSLFCGTMAFTVPADELQFRASRASGRGGQHVNKASTRVEVRWNIARSSSLTARERERLLRKLKTRINSRGVLRVVADERRSQWRNRQAATTRLNALVKEALKTPKRRKKTKPSRSVIEQRLEAKRQHGQLKRRRRPVQPDE